MNLQEFLEEFAEAARDERVRWHVTKYLESVRGVISHEVEGERWVPEFCPIELVQYLRVPQVPPLRVSNAAQELGLHQKDRRRIIYAADDKDNMFFTPTWFLRRKMLRAVRAR